MPMKETGKQSSEGSDPPCEQPGTSRDPVEPAGTSSDIVELASQNLSCKEVALVPQPEKVSYSTELFRTWRDLRWFQIPLSSLRRPKAGLFSFRFQSSLQEYQQLRKSKRLKVGRPFSVLPFPGLSVTLSDCFQNTLYKQPGKQSESGRVKSCKSLLAGRAAPLTSLPARPQHHLQPHHQCLTILSASDTCDWEDRQIATAQKPVVGASGRNCRGQPWNKMSPVPPGPQHRLPSSHHYQRRRSTLLVSDVCGSKNSRIAKAKIPTASASQVNSAFTERVAPGPSSMQPHVLLRRICLAQDGCETALQDWDEPRPCAHRLRTEEPTLMQPCVRLRRISLARNKHKTAPQEWGESRAPDDQSQTKALMPMQPRVLLHRISLVQDQCRTALEEWGEPRPCNSQSCTEELIPTQPRVVLHRVCLDQCRTAPKDRDEPRYQENQSCTEELNPKQPRVRLRRVCLDQGETASEGKDELRCPDFQPGAEKLQPCVLLHRICLAQVQCKTVPQDWDEPRPSDHQAGVEKPVAVSEGLSSVHTGEREAEPDGASLAMGQPFCSPSANQPPTAPPPAQAKEARPRRKGIQRHWRHSSSHLHLANLSEWGIG
ncbi:uncharacterized protein LOC132580764 isoform X2 [Heteronotia binoei]|uniref:uncharacterized protein LOC132580764 isoform X2 n=1 Tax=Heteronotia binoei TaxID=13085 RepID=UPI00292F1C91|nr:uncharacterized protein LOC132580764 isoform X2 [Heteronotia binoei]XP_060107810.1 uncharacterized protein LOC132580764 isoform X2 [Heteronotia binoei]XP_060107811.1 uncharacterized protein LOC132580764 isoform X2 [Heteronotia binoei]XP_060107812.1 uncharacterized protein LOC132580764 isoform X2 [Heteronotia binoei]